MARQTGPPMSCDHRRFGVDTVQDTRHGFRLMAKCKECGHEETRAGNCLNFKAIMKAIGDKRFADALEAISTVERPEK